MIMIWLFLTAHAHSSRRLIVITLGKSHRVTVACSDDRFILSDSHYLIALHTSLVLLSQNPLTGQRHNSATAHYQTRVLAFVLLIVAVRDVFLL
jgi:hypothetical protein